jgi:hypothetical protein
MTTVYNHLVIPDTQCKPGLRLDYLTWAGQYAVDHFISKQRPLRIIHLGDHWDMPSLSSYDKGKGKMEGRRVHKDIEAGNNGFAALDEPIATYLRKNKVTAAPVDKRLLRGNHEDRISRAIDQDAQLDGLLGLHLLESFDWRVHDFLDVVNIDGVLYSHYFQNRGTGRAMAGENLKLQLKNIGASHTQGHRQTFDYATRFTAEGVQQCALVAGAYYVHDEDYLGMQGNAHWRGLVVCHKVRRGAYNVMQVDLDFLCERYAGVSLSKYKTRHYS